MPHPNVVRSTGDVKQGSQHHVLDVSAASQAPIVDWWAAVASSVSKIPALCFNSRSSTFVVEPQAPWTVVERQTAISPADEAIFQILLHMYL